MPVSFGWCLFLITGGIKMPEKKNVAFNFGINWKNYSDNALDESKINDAQESLDKLIGTDKIKTKSFLDIGSGSGIFAIAASKAGAKNVLGIDISQESVKTSQSNKQRFLPQSNIEFLHKSIFDENINELGRFDIVYSWGVLHHTGDMYKAIDIASTLVDSRGLLVLAIYNKHWSSPLWTCIKRFYNLSPALIQRLMVYFFGAVIASAKLLVTGKNPFKKKRRGMSFFYDIVDWLGGYPYQYAHQSQINDFVQAKGFKLIKTTSPAVPTGCNEFIFQKIT